MIETTAGVKVGPGPGVWPWPTVSLANLYTPLSLLKYVLVAGSSTTPKFPKYEIVYKGSISSLFVNRFGIVTIG